MLGKILILMLLISILPIFSLEVDAQDMTTQVLYSFEDGVDGWGLVVDWAGGLSVEHSMAMGNENESALQLTVQFSGSTWEESGAFVNPSTVTDWSRWERVSVDIYVPPETEGFIAQIFVKTGAEWAWANSSDTTLSSGEWTTINADLSQMGQIDNVRELGIKIGTSTTAFEGVFLIDNVVLSRTMIENDIVAEPVAVVRAIVEVSPLATRVGQYERFEVVVDLDADFNNPYDPLDIRLVGIFTSPSGQVMTVPGFYYHAFEQTLLPSGRELISPTYEQSWRIRFTPMEIGAWSYQVVASTNSTTATIPSQNFTATASDRHGFIRVDERNPNYLTFDDGTPYFAVGENIAWYGSGGTADYLRWMEALSAADGNFIRVWLASWGFGFEWSDTGLGNYDLRQQQAFQLDKVFEIAAEHDIYIMLTLLNHGAFSPDVDPEWNANPLNAVNGGPLSEPHEFATNPEAIRLWYQKLRYIAARWGYSPNLIAWEWWNEVNWTQLVDPSLLQPWMEGSAAYLEELDPYNHLITHSGSPIEDKDIWELESIDIVQHHQYNIEDITQEFHAIITQWRAAYPTKPFLMGEFGSPSDNDNQGIFVHLGLWSAPMHGSFGTAMTWWWDSYVHPNDLYQHFSGIEAFFVGEDLAAHQWMYTNSTLSEDATAQIYGLQDENTALLWIVSNDYSPTYFEQAYAENPSNQITFPEVNNVGLHLNGLTDGEYDVEWWDTYTGEIIETNTVQIIDGQANINVPVFSTDLAVKVR